MTMEAPVYHRQLKKCVSPVLSGEMIGKIARQHHYVDHQVRISDLDEELKLNPDVWCLAVLDSAGKSLGIIVTSRLQAQLSRPFGREILGKKTAGEAAEPAASFPYDKHIQGISEKLQAEVQEISNRFYLLEDYHGKFCGLFSTKDLLIHLFVNHRSDLALAGRLQEALVPKNWTHQGPEVEMVGYSNPAKGVGGDYYGIREYSPGKWSLAVCDVSGKGVAASLVTTALGGMFSLADFSQGQRPFITGLNSFVLHTFKMEKYLTGIFLDMDLAARELKVYDMGHGYFYLFRGGKVLKRASENPFIGFVPELTPKGYRLALEPGDLVVVLTDGFVEQHNATGEEYGLARIEKFLQDRKNGSLVEIKQALHEELKAFRGEVPRGDDETVFLIRIPPCTPGQEVL